MQLFTGELGGGGAYDGKPLVRSVSISHPLCDLAGRLTMHHLFLLLQEIAGDDSERVGLGRQFVVRENIFWVLSRVSVAIHRMPKWPETIRVVTYYGQTVRYVYPRYFLIEDSRGERIAEASTLWMLIDRDRREIVMPSQRGYAMPPPPEGVPRLDAPGRIVFPFEPDSAAVRTPVYSDFDINGHMNNARYPLWINDLFPPSLYKGHSVASLQLNYVREIMEGEAVGIDYGLRDGVFVARGAVGGETRFEAVGSFREEAPHA